MMNPKCFLSLCAGLLPLPCLQATPIAFEGGLLVESFNNPAFNAKGNTTLPWDGEPAVAGWVTTAEDPEIQFGWSGAVSAGRMYGYRFDSSGETSPTAGSLGARTTAQTGPIAYALGLENTTGETIDGFTLSFDAFVVNYQDETADKLGFAYGIGADFDSAAFSEVPEAAYIPPDGSGKGNPLPETVEAFRVSVEDLSWEPGEVLWLRWTDHQDDTYGSMGMGIDHLHFSTDVPKVRAYRPWEFPEEGVTETLVVNNAHPDADDGNAGTETAPLRTIQAAVEIAGGHSSDGKGTRIQVHPGVYREVVDITSRSGNEPLILEGVGEGEVVISGSDVFGNWVPSEIEGVYEHAWPYDFGWEANPWPGDLALKYREGTRRELLFINKNPMTQVIGEENLSEGTYLVEEENDRILLYPPAGTNPAEELVEIGVRPLELYGVDSKMIRIFRVNNVKLSNLVVEHGAVGSLANDAAVAIRGSSNIVVEDVTLRWNNGFGISFSGQGDTPGENIRVTNHVNIGSGAVGMSGGGINNILLDGGEIRFANWRGALWGATGWAPCGFKFASYNGMHMRDYRIAQSHATGGWMDAHNRDVLIERLYSVNNYRSGMSLEANRGPITIRDSIFFGNSTGINGFDNSGVVLENCFIAENSERQVRFAGSHPLTEAELEEFDAGWSRERQRMRHIPEDWRLRNNLLGFTVESSSNRMFNFGLRSGSFNDDNGDPVFHAFVDTYEGADNEYYLPNETADYPAFPNLFDQPVSLSEWETLTGETGASLLSSGAFAMALTEAEGVAGEEATGFSGLATAVPVITVEAEQPVAREDGSLIGSFRIRREGGDLSLPVQVAFTMGGSAVMGSDYTEVEESVLLESGESGATVDIIAVADGEAEFEESVTLQVSADIDGIYKLGNPFTAAVSIADGDAVVPSEVDAHLGIGSPVTSYPVVITNPTDQVMEVEVGSLSMHYEVLHGLDDATGAFPWREPDGGVNDVAFNWTATNNDGLSGPVDLGFAFPFYGGNYEAVRIHSNGFLTFHEPANASWRFTFLKELPATEQVPLVTMIAPYWSDLAMDSVSSVESFASGGAFVVEFRDLYRYGVFGAKQRATFQVVLYPTGEIRFLYEEIGYTSPSHSIGLQDSSKEAGISLSFNGGSIASGARVRLVPPTAWLAVTPPSFTLGAAASREISLVLHPEAVLHGRYPYILPLRNAGDGSRLFNIPVTLEVGDTNDLLADAWRMEDYRWSPWFGSFDDRSQPWLYHFDLGWIYPAQTDENSLWLYVAREGGWFWTSQWFYAWGWNPDAGWVYLR